MDLDDVRQDRSTSPDERTARGAGSAEHGGFRVVLVVRLRTVTLSGVAVNAIPGVLEESSTSVGAPFALTDAPDGSM